MAVDTAMSARSRLVRLLLAEQEAPPGGLPRDPDGSVPAAPVQWGLWLHEQLSDRPGLYNVPAAVRLRGPLDRAALRVALDAVVARHDILRTSFAETGGRLRQYVADTVTVPWIETDLSGLPADQRTAAVREAGAAEVGTPFELDQAPLVRARLWRLGDTEHVLLITAHHLVTDGWSAGVLWHDLDACYAAARAHRAAPLPPLTVQYGDFALWQEARLRHAGGQHAAYWRDRLRDLPGDLELPADLPRPRGEATAGGPGASSPVRLPEQLADDLRALAASRRCSLFAVLLSGFAALVHRLTGAGDLLVAVPVTSRAHDVVEPLIGYFVNLVPIRLRAGSGTPFASLADRTVDALAGALAHRDLPVDVLEGARRPAPRVSFSMSGSPAAGTVGGLPAEPAWFPQTTAKFDLTLALLESPSGPVTGAWEYRTDLFHEVTVDRLTARLRTLLAAACADPAREIGQLPLIDPAEHDLVVGWSRGPRRATGTAAKEEK